MSGTKCDPGLYDVPPYRSPDVRSPRYKVVRTPQDFKSEPDVELLMKSLPENERVISIYPTWINPRSGDVWLEALIEVLP